MALHRWSEVRDQAWARRTSELLIDNSVLCLAMMIMEQARTRTFGPSSRSHRAKKSATSQEGRKSQQRGPQALQRFTSPFPVQEMESHATAPVRRRRLWGGKQIASVSRNQETKKPERTFAPLWTLLFRFILTSDIDWQRGSSSYNLFYRIALRSDLVQHQDNVCNLPSKGPQ